MKGCYWKDCCQKAQPYKPFSAHPLLHFSTSVLTMKSKIVVNFSIFPTIKKCACIIIVLLYPRFCCYFCWFCLILLLVFGLWIIFELSSCFAQFSYSNPSIRWFINYLITVLLSEFDSWINVGQILGFFNVQVMWVRLWSYCQVDNIEAEALKLWRVRQRHYKKFRKMIWDLKLFLFLLINICRDVVII